MSRRPLGITVVGVNYPPEPTGISPYTGALARGLARRGFATRVVTSHPHYPAWRIAAGYGQWTSKEAIDDVDVVRLRHYVPARPSGVRRLLSELSFGARAALARWRRPDLIVTVSPALFASAIAAVRARLFHRGVPLVVWVQDLYWLGLSETGQATGRAAFVIKHVESWLLRRADRVVVIHDRFKQRVIDDFGLEPARVEVIRNWTHFQHPPTVDRGAARVRFGWGDELVVLHAGNMGVKQGLDNVLDAGRLADEQRAPVRFVLLGSGGEHARLKAGGDDIARVQFIDPLPDADFALALAAADVLLVNEKVGVAEMAVPSKLTSYFSTGRPVLAATDVAGITADEIRAAEAGEIVPAGRPADLLAAALALGDDGQRCEELGSNGLRYRKRNLNETSAIDRFATLLSQLTDGNGA